MCLQGKVNLSRIGSKQIQQSSDEGGEEDGGGGEEDAVLLIFFLFETHIQNTVNFKNLRLKCVSIS